MRSKVSIAMTAMVAMPATLDIALAHATEVALRQRRFALSEGRRGGETGLWYLPSEVELQLRKSVHARAERESDADPGEVLHCNRCHGATGPRHAACGDTADLPCIWIIKSTHVAAATKKTETATWQTIHGKGLFESGLVIAACLLRLPRCPRHLLCRR